MSLPDRITTMAHVTYNTEDIRQAMREYNPNPTDEHVLALLRLFAREDFGGGAYLTTEDGTVIA